MADYAVMPVIDYEDACDAIREKDGSTAVIKSGEMGAKIRAIAGASPPSVYVETENGCTVYATNGTVTVSAVAVDGSACLELSEGGTWSVYVTQGNITSLYRTIVLDEELNLFFEIPPIDPILDNNSWDTIRKISDEGTGENFWSVGEKKAVLMNGTVDTLTFNDEVIYAFIIGFNHNKDLEGDKRIHFQFGKNEDGEDIAFCAASYSTSNSVNTQGFYMAAGSTNTAVGWSSCIVRSLLGTNLTNYTGTLIGCLPDEVRNILKPVTKYSNNVGQSAVESAITPTEDYMFLLSVFEALGQYSSCNPYEQRYQEMYKYYAAGNSVVKKRHNGKENVAHWTRSHRKSDGYFIDINSSGRSGLNMCYLSLAVAPAFCV